jgi:hypothetical protein
MIEFSVTSTGLEFSELAQKISGPLKQKLIERLTDIAFAAAFWGAPVKTGYLASTVYKQVTDSEGVVGVAASYARVVVEGSAPHEIRPANGECCPRGCFVIPVANFVGLCFRLH